MLKGFKDFINKGNVIDLAVAVVIGAAFAPVISSLTEKVLMPLISAIFGQPNFDTLGEFHIGTTAIQPGFFLTAVVNFLIVAAAIYFFVVTPMNKLKKKKEEPAPEAPAADVVLLTEIRDLLARR
ncbi:large conductance mechanosensitive channel protein MscL [Arcanobacterium haemolyticum]|uniref:Large-conductance mechanosensitive channel n=1 Tax=Arcanobacterium haemolyticum (strain ATCC 9345 / DSM 20595 / CCM 5947 / CCUG 17215 / LMG 16163 / NBRC 15585 / NCTC 8452 / 11018) TaxID=644284 RepID=D7BKW9_ARCHD|nr:large conductance mechanosensitive channel protein MscL [Arcanobacterium haemolyticum]ADH93299.1 large conductance mechanosensitive channel protein [Arcanobacterium haemolyticum DSM 20595]QCX47330.1 large conductance mechanosensitive channel protein MscL [Arcanobacterium haemolyticum]SQH27868.1 Large-conductance mechanosensitive channel [Arcanobacterium haemolyticum]